jgi:CheY-like chemotaxis protein
MLLKRVDMQQDTIFGKRILVIDDDPSARESMKLLLSIDRHSVTEARDGMEALALVAGQPFDLVLVDFFMPQMNGGEVARRIKQIAPSLRILMVTAYLEKLINFEGTGNTDAVLGKPFAVGDLRSEIAKLLPSDGQSEQYRN